MPKLSATQFVGFGKETTWGTVAATFKYIPINSFKVEEEIKKVVDEGRRANLTKDFAVYNGPRSAKFDMDTYLYTNEVGYMLQGLMGAPTTTGTGTYSHTFKLASTQPPSLSINDFNGISTRQSTGVLIDEISIKFSEDKMVEVSTKGQMKPSAIITTPTPTFGTVDPVHGVTTTFTLAGSANTNLVGATITMKREVKMLHGADGTQNPTKGVSGRLEVTGKVTFDVEDESEYLNFINQTNPALVFTFNGATANNKMVVTLSKVDITKANVDRSQEWVRVDMDFRALYNVTDAGPVSIVLSNTTTSY